MLNTVLTITCIFRVHRYCTRVGLSLSLLTHSPKRDSSKLRDNINEYRRQDKSRHRYVGTKKNGRDKQTLVKSILHKHIMQTQADIFPEKNICFGSRNIKFPTIHETQ